MAKTNDTKSESKFGFKDIPPEYLYTKGDNTLVKLGGLLYLASKMGTFRCVTRNVSTSDDEIVYESEGYIIPSMEYLASKGISTDYPLIDMYRMPVIAHGTTNARNLASNMVQFRVVMAETRAIARCLRVLTECPLCSVEEMNGYTFSEDDILDMAKTTNVCIQSAQDVMKSSRVEPKTRIELINAIQSMYNREGVKEYASSYFKSHNANVILNLSDALLKDLYNNIIQMVAE